MFKACLVLLTIGMIGGCADFFNSQPGAVVAEATYTADLLKCIDDYNTKAEIDNCRQSVNKRWGVSPPNASAATKDAAIEADAAETSVDAQMSDVSQE